MTNAEYLNILIPEVSQGIKNAIMEARNLDGAASYNGGEAIELVTADLYYHILLIPEFSEGSLSIKYNASSLKAAANRIYKLYNDPRYDGGEPLIRRVKL